MRPSALTSLTSLTSLTVLLACTPKPAPPAGPSIQTREVEYHAGNTTLHGYLAWDSAKAGKRPGILIVHEWWGIDDHVRKVARELAEAGYVGFAVDMYGDGKYTAHPDSAQQFMNAAMASPAGLNARFAAAREELLKDPHVDSTKLGAIGYCFGGAVVLGQARAGADLAAVVTFHGALVPGKVDSGAVKGRVLVLTGADDPFVPPAAVESFRKEMTAAGAHFNIVTYPGAKHGFTNPRADSVGMPQLAYNADVDRKSWAAMLALFKELW